MNNEKIERNIKIVKLRDEAGLTFSRIAEEMQVSRQMIHKVYNQTKRKMTS